MDAGAEARMRALWSAQDYNACAELALESYGPEVYSFLIARFSSGTAAVDDAFSEFSEDLWRGLAGFEWRCAMRSYCYRLARSAAARIARSPYNKRSRRVPISQISAIEAALDRVRTSTAPYLRTTLKDEVARLRDSLSDDDRELLTLRVDRRLSWREIAFILGDSSAVANDTDRKFQAALRQRFAEIKRRIRRKAEESGIL
jgi:RNA polymerase sigma-70 factor (ECF subfamily)